MKTRKLSNAVLATAALILAVQAQGLSQQSKPPLYPSLVGLSCFYGISASRVIGEGLRKTYFAPTSSTQMVIGQPFGIELEGVYYGHFGLASGFRWHQFGQNTKPREVMFRDDIYTHEFQTTAEISYFSVPFILKGGLMKENYWAFVRLGAIGQIATGENLDWQIDGHDVKPGSPRMPAVVVNSTTSSYLLGGESGVRFGRNGFFLLGDLFYGRNSFVSGLPGKAIMQAAEFFLGYRRFF